MVSVRPSDQDETTNIQEYIRRMAITEWCPLLLNGRGGAVGSGCGVRGD